MKTRILRTVFVFFVAVALFCFSGLAMAQDNPDQEVSNPAPVQPSQEFLQWIQRYPQLSNYLAKWMNSTELGLFANNLVWSLFHIDNAYFKKLGPEAIKEIKKSLEEEMCSMLSKLDSSDPHSLYFNSKQAKRGQEEIAGQFEGIGVRIEVPGILELQKRYFEIIRQRFPKVSTLPEFLNTIVDYLSKNDSEFADLDKRLTNPIVPEQGFLIVEVFPGQGADKAGIKEGWFIDKVNGKEIAGRPVEEVLHSIRGPAGTKVKLTLKPPEQETSSVECIVERGVVETFAVEHRMLTDDIGYIKIKSFKSEKTGQEFKDAVKDLQALGMKEKLVIDVRDNHGGLFGVTDEILEVLLPAGRVEVYSQGRDEKQRMLSAWSPPEIKVPKIFSGKIIILINEYSASASELVAISLKEQLPELVTIIGRKSFGKGSIQTSFLLPDGSTLHLTTGRYFSPVKGKCIHGEGIEPDIEIVDNPDTPEDEVLLGAIRVLSE